MTRGFPHMAEPAGDYHRGEMDIHEQAGTYHAFLAVSKWFSLALGATLIFLVIWFCTKAGFLSGFVSGLVILILGVLALRSRPGDTGH
jgi:hypothetical protein